MKTLTLTHCHRANEKILVNWDNVTSVKHKTNSFGDEYTQINFLKGSVDVAESVDEIEMKLID